MDGSMTTTSVTQTQAPASVPNMQIQQPMQSAAVQEANGIAHQHLNGLGYTTAPTMRCEATQAADLAVAFQNAPGRLGGNG